MKYGTPPVVRATGGLADTVTDASPVNLAAGTASGFTFQVFNTEGLLEGVRRAIGLYRDYGDLWRGLIRGAMRQDWSWDRSAVEYEKLYRRIVAM